MRRKHGKLAEFMNSDIQYNGFGIIPKEYESMTYMVFFLVGPWLAGVIFIFLYVFKGSLELFSTIDLDVLLTWSIGYEVLASIILLGIFKKFMVHMFSTST